MRKNTINGLELGLLRGRAAQGCTARLAANATIDVLGVQAAGARAWAAAAA